MKTRPIRHTRPVWIALATSGVCLALPHAASADPASFLDTRFVRAAVHHAVARAGLDVDVPGSLAARARASGWLPTLHLRVAHGLGSALTQTEYDPTVDTSRNNESWLLDVRLTFHLERLAFDSAEVGIQRLALERSARRRQVERDVLELLAALEVARTALSNDHAPPDEAIRARVEYAQSRAALELLTGVPIEDLERGH